MKNKNQKAKLKRLLNYPEVQSWRMLMTSFQTIYGLLEKSLLQEGSYISRFQILFLLYFDGPLSATQIASKLLVTRGNISMFLKRIELDGLIHTVFVPSKKRPLYQLTHKGKVFFETIFPRHISRVRKWVPVLSSSLQSELKKINKKFICKQIYIDSDSFF